MTDDYMCPFCVKPWKCNGPHIEPEDMAEFEAYRRSQYDLGFRAALDAAETAVAEALKERMLMADCSPNTMRAPLFAIRALKEKP